MRLTHVGGPTVLVEVAGWRILTDPTFDPPGRRYAFGWGTSSVKTAGPALDPGAVGAVDVVLLSHDHHADNLDDAGRALLGSAVTVLTTRAGGRRLGGTTRGLAPWEEVELTAPGRPALTITATPARHGPPLTRPIVGEVTGFAVRVGAGRRALWMSGDTVLHAGVREVAERVEVHTALLHLGRVRFPLTGPLAFSMGGREAVRTIRLLGPAAVVPVHFEGWSHFSEQEGALRAVLDAAPPDVTDRLRWLERGVPRELSDPG